MSSANILRTARILQASGVNVWGEIRALVAADREIPAQAKVAVAAIIRERYESPSVDVIPQMLRELATGTWEDFGWDKRGFDLPSLDALKAHIVAQLADWLLTRTASLATELADLLRDPASFHPDPISGSGEARGQ